MAKNMLNDEKAAELLNKLTGMVGLTLKDWIDAEKNALDYAYKSGRAYGFRECILSMRECGVTCPICGIACAPVDENCELVGNTLQKEWWCSHCDGTFKVEYFPAIPRGNWGYTRENKGINVGIHFTHQIIGKFLLSNPNIGKYRGDEWKI